MLTNESFMPSEAECAETLREIRWSNGVTCVECGSKDVKCRTTAYRKHYHRYECKACGRWFNDYSETIFEYSKVPLRYWFYTICEVDKGQPATDIAESIPFSYQATLNMVHAIQESIYQGSVVEKLNGEVEVDDIHLKTGQQGLECQGREPRERGLKARGRGRYETDRPLLVVWVERDNSRLALELCRDAGARTLTTKTLKNVEPNSRIDSDTWRGYNWLDEQYDHHTVKHSERYVAEDGAHCNTAEAEWSVFRTWWRTFRGVAKRYAYRYLATYAYQRNQRDASSIKRLHKVISFCC
jgi:transposase-like protein